MVHARRYFIEAELAFPEHCERVLEDIATIYRNDNETRDMDPDERLAFHQQHSRPIMDALYKWIEEQFRERVVEPNSRLGKAFSYVKNHWQGLTLFLEVPSVPLDNNVRNMSTTLGHSRAAFSEPRRLMWSSTLVD